MVASELVLMLTIINTKSVNHRSPVMEFFHSIKRTL